MRRLLDPARCSVLCLLCLARSEEDGVAQSRAVVRSTLLRANDGTLHRLTLSAKEEVRQGRATQSAMACVGRSCEYFDLATPVKNAAHSAGELSLISFINSTEGSDSFLRSFDDFDNNFDMGSLDMSGALDEDINMDGNLTSTSEDIGSDIDQDMKNMEERMRQRMEKMKEGMHVNTSSKNAQQVQKVHKVTKCVNGTCTTNETACSNGHCKNKLNRNEAEADVKERAADSKRAAALRKARALSASLKKELSDAEVPGKLKDLEDELENGLATSKPLHKKTSPKAAKNQNANSSVSDVYDAASSSESVARYTTCDGKNCTTSIKRCSNGKCETTRAKGDLKHRPAAPSKEGHSKVLVELQGARRRRRIISTALSKGYRMRATSTK